MHKKIVSSLYFQVILAITIGISEIPSFLETQIIPSVRVYKRCCFR